MGLIESDASRLPLLPLEGEARERLAATLRGLGLVDTAGGRISPPSSTPSPASPSSTISAPEAVG
jgi:hypothetical protein